MIENARIALAFFIFKHIFSFAVGDKLRKVFLYIKKKSPSDFIRFEFAMLIRKQSFSLFLSARGDKLFLVIQLIDGLLIIRKNISLLKE